MINNFKFSLILVFLLAVIIWSSVSVRTVDGGMFYYVDSYCASEEVCYLKFDEYQTSSWEKIQVFNAEGDIFLSSNLPSFVTEEYNKYGYIKIFFIENQNLVFANVYNKYSSEYIDGRSLQTGIVLFEVDNGKVFNKDQLFRAIKSYAGSSYNYMLTPM